MTTKVIFRKTKNPYTKEDEIIAFFPEIPGDMNPYTNCLSYQHVGQHGAASLEFFYKDTIPATGKELEDLLEEIISLGYENIKISYRINDNDLQKRIKACKI